MSRIAYVNGRYLPQNDAKVPVEARGYQFADGVYEVCEVRGGHLIDEKRHMARLDRSLRELRMARPMSQAALAVVLREVDWLPLYAAVERLSRSYERAFLENVGPLAVEAAVANPSRLKINATPAKRRRAGPMKPAWPPLAEPAPELEPLIDSPEPMPGNPEAAPLVEADPPEPARAGTAGASQDRRKGLAGLLRGWLRRGA